MMGGRLRSGRERGVMCVVGQEKKAYLSSLQIVGEGVLEQQDCNGGCNSATLVAVRPLSGSEDEVVVIKEEYLAFPGVKSSSGVSPCYETCQPHGIDQQYIQPFNFKTMPDVMTEMPSSQVHQ